MKGAYFVYLIGQVFIFFIEKLSLPASLFCILTLSIFSLGSCKKDDPSPEKLTVAADTLKGKEFVFVDSVWQGDYLYFVSTPVRPDLFRYPLINPDISIKFDTATNWTRVLPTPNFIDDEPFIYHYIDPSDRCVVKTSYPFPIHLTGRKVAIKASF